MNTVTLTGNLGSAPTLGGQDGTISFARFSLAINTRYKKDDGERAERTDWFQIVAFGAVAKSIADLRSGDQVGVTGALRSNSWESKSGEKHTSVEVIAHSVEFLRLKDREAAAA